MKPSRNKGRNGHETPHSRTVSEEHRHESRTAPASSARAAESCQNPPAPRPRTVTQGRTQKSHAAPRRLLVSVQIDVGRMRVSFGL
jgi:hypothetical protein